MLTNTEKSPYAKTYSLPWDAVTWTGGIWAEVFKTCAENTVPHIRQMFEDRDISHVVENFRIAAREIDGSIHGTPFGDGDFYKWMEAAIYVACKNNDGKLLREIDEYIDLISRAQLDDGYISTKQIIGEIKGENITRLGDINNFEVYNFGHLFTTACIHKRLTGLDNLLNVAVKAAEYLEKTYQEAAGTGEVKTAVCPSHYMGLVEMYRTTGNKRFLDLARLAINLRDSVKNGTDDNHDRIPLKKHEKIVGHAVRSNYLYAGVSDLYAETGDSEYLDVLHRVWKDLVEHKIYITGGCGALYNGVSPYGNFWIDQKVHQAYGHEYQLPNLTAYNETCASVGSVLWAYRMFTVEPKAHYFDVIEKTMLNVNLAAISLDGRKFFYENMLRRARKLPFELCWPLERKEYISSFCCPPNLARLLAETSEYAYCLSDDTVWLGMYGENEARIRLRNGASFTVAQKTQYPFDGNICFSFRDTNGKGFKLNIRIPDWAESGHISVNGRVIKEISVQDSSTYYTLNVEKPSETNVTVRFDMPVRLTIAHPLVETDINQVAVERGPVVYCIESHDTELETLDDLMIGINSDFTPVEYEITGRKIIALEGEALKIKRDGDDSGKLYRTLKFKGLKRIHIRLVPYFAWDNRGFGEMKIWLPVAFC
ncbi:hypothetical protein CSTERTH_01465 [Thermoclostridium stercorarium subsp. thermolacticum DSM 2910]|uniref:Non-reducing end beta-L-arabinofuranosidase n=1 Tax=Thermoclostridium stercorarium subsp. thermolacticum DSM 2910 TaxID=1121336 RepID=A0A1B1YAJ7_THEST|nr:beta-L-arabinofuranosidase domain-containing protein [Thermoclostridium stercorarium]ANW97794.1 hypothetical protein CSTERTH_01465 [Thermoclostridium stercorarium subsp. thermolacticum DSM 2910]